MILVYLGWGWDPEPYKENRISRQFVCLCCDFLRLNWSGGGLICLSVVFCLT